MDIYNYVYIFTILYCIYIYIILSIIYIYVYIYISNLYVYSTYMCVYIVCVYFIYKYICSYTPTHRPWCAMLIREARSLPCAYGLQTVPRVKSVSMYSSGPMEFRWIEMLLLLFQHFDLGTCGFACMHVWEHIPCFWRWTHAVPNFLHFRAEVLTRGQCTPCQVPGFFLKVRGRMILDAPRVFTPNPVMSHTFDEWTLGNMAGRWCFACWDCAGYVNDPLHHGCGRLPDAAQGGCLNVAHEFWKSICCSILHSACRYSLTTIRCPVCFIRPDQ